MVNWCDGCGGHGSGRVRDPSAKWWQFWKTVPCVACGGDGLSKPPGWPDRDTMRRLRPVAPPAPPRAEPRRAIVEHRHVGRLQCNHSGCGKECVTFHGIGMFTHGYCDEHRCCAKCGLQIAACDCPSGHHTERAEYLGYGVEVAGTDACHVRKTT